MAMTMEKDLIREIWSCPSSLPPQKERINLLNDFKEAHARAFGKAIHCEILLRGGVDNFDFKRHYMKFDLRFRRDCGGNPGVAFSVENAEIRPLSEIDSRPGYKASLEAGQANDDASAAHFKATKQSFVGLFMVLYCMEGYGLWQANELCHTDPTFDAALKRLHPELWLRELQKTVEMGMVFRKTNPDDLGQKFGRIKRVGLRWKWVQLTPQELVEIGMPADCPGLLF
jgi:hypothetical protein